MSWPVYTERLLASSTPNQWVGWTVPPGKRAVVKSLIVSNWETSAGTAYINVANSCVYAKQLLYRPTARS